MAIKRWDKNRPALCSSALSERKSSHLPERAVTKIFKQLLQSSYDCNLHGKAASFAPSNGLQSLVMTDTILSHPGLKH